MSNKKSKAAPRMMGGAPMGRMATGKPKNFKKSLKDLAIYLKPYWIGIVTSLIFAALGTVFAIVGPKVMARITEEILKGMFPGATTDFVKIGTIGGWLVALYLVSTILQYIQNFIMSGITARVSKNLRNDIAKKINRLPLKYFDGNSYGDVLSRITNDVDNVGQTLNQALSNMITSVTMLVGILVMMLTISGTLTLVAVVTVPVSLGLIMLVVKFSQKYFMKQQLTLGSLNGTIEEVYSNHNVVKVFNGEERSESEFAEFNNSLFKDGYKAQFFSGLMMPIMQFIGNISFVFICVLGGIIALKDPLFIASILAFIQYVRQFNQPIAQLSSIASTLQSTAASSERVFEFLNEADEVADTGTIDVLDNVKGNVEFKHVNFGYSQDKQIIFDFNCTASAGQKIAIVGPTGAGKTTLVNLLMRFYEIDSGDILIDNVSIKDIKRGTLRRLFGMVLQDTWLFEGTIKENLKYGNPDATDEDVVKACQIAGVDHFIRTLSNGYNMVLDADASLSSGQKQLLTIARATVQDSPMLILDEATSSVDTRTEQLIQESMDRLMKHRTTFVIAHRLSTIKNADIILVMKDGNVIESGNHEELMEKGGFYKDLYNSQFSKESAEVTEI